MKNRWYLLLLQDNGVLFPIPYWQYRASSNRIARGTTRGTGRPRWCTVKIQTGHWEYIGGSMKKKNTACQTATELNFN